MEKILFLGYDRTETSLIDFLEDRNFKITAQKEKVDNFQGYDSVISFGYRFIISKEQINSSENPIINLHTSYLPYNRGTYPNFWSCVENTPAGVTIHEIDEGVDTGDIIFQERVYLVKKGATFISTYQMLKEKIETLFKIHHEALLKKTYKSFKQKGLGTYHSKKDLPDWLAGWDMEIEEAIKRHQSETTQS